MKSFKYISKSEREREREREKERKIYLPCTFDFTHMTIDTR